jgi:hypothetical protein
MIDLKNRIIFVHIPKCAGTSTEHYFMQIQGLDYRNRAALGIFKNRKSANLERDNQHCTLSMIEDLWFGGEIPADFRIFTVVRDPYRRFWSEYSYRRLPPPDRFRFSTHLPLDLLIYLAKHPVARLKDLDSHMRPQWTYLEGRAKPRARVLRFERLGEDFAALVRDWDLPNLALPRLNQGGDARRQTTAAQQAKGNAFVREFYAEDFVRLGYHPQLPAVSAPKRSRRPGLRPRSANAAD